MSNVRQSHRIGKRAISALLSVSMVTAGVAVLNTSAAPAAFAQPAGGAQNVGTGAVAISGTPTAGDSLKVHAKGVAANAKFNLKLSAKDGSEAGKFIDFSATEAEDPVKFDSNKKTLVVESNSEGVIDATIKLPSDLKGATKLAIRFLAPGFSQESSVFTLGSTYTYNEGVQSTAPDNVVKLSATADTDRARGYVDFELKNTNFEAGDTLTAKIDGVGVQLYAKRELKSDIKLSKAKDVSGSVALDKRFAVGNHVLTLTATDTTGKVKTYDVSFEVTKPYAALLDQYQATLPNASIGAKVDFRASHLPDGWRIRFIGVGKGTELGSRNFLADKQWLTVENNEVYLKGLNIPNDPALVGQMVTITAVKSDGKSVSFDTPIRITANNNSLNADQYEVTRSPEYIAENGLYQVVRGADKLFVTRANRSADSDLLQVDPETLKVDRKASLGKIDGLKDNAINAIYGIDVDNEKRLIWTTNTRTGAVTVFDQDNLTIKKTFPAGTLGHPRDVIVDKVTHKVYVTDVSGSQNGGAIQIFDGNNLKANPVPLAGLPIDNSASAVLDQETGDFYITSMNNPKKIVHLNVRDTDPDVRSSEELAGIDSPTGIAYNPKTKEIYLANQGSNDLAVYDTKTAKLSKTIPVGAGALYVRYEPVHDRIYVTNRTSGTLTVLDANSHEVIANIPVGYYPNDIRIDGKGGIYLVNKSSQLDSSIADQILHIVPKVTAPAPDPTPVPVDPTPTTKATTTATTTKAPGNPGSNSGSSDSPLGKVGSVLGVLFGFGLLAAAIGGLIHFLKTHPLPHL